MIYQDECWLPVAMDWYYTTRFWNHILQVVSGFCLEQVMGYDLRPPMLPKFPNNYLTTMNPPKKMNRLWFLNMNFVYQRQWTDFSSLLNWVHGCDLIQSLLQHAKLLGTRGHAPMFENMFPHRPWFWICTPLVCEIVWKCPKWIELWDKSGMRRKNEEVKKMRLRYLMFSLGAIFAVILDYRKVPWIWSFFLMS